MSAAVALLREPAEQARYPLARARWQLVSLLREYHLFKCVEVFDPAKRSGSPVQAQQADAMLRTCRDGWTAYCGYTLEWSGRDIAAVWPAYTRAMKEMVAQLRGHVAREEALVAQLLSRSERTRHLVH